MMIVGEGPGSEEIRQGRPFVGLSGKELDTMLAQVGILRSACYLTNVALTRPRSGKLDDLWEKEPKGRTAGVPGPELIEGMRRLANDINEVKPQIILALGNVALWALTGQTGIRRWRGSEMEIVPSPLLPVTHTCTVVPTMNPAAILRQWSWRIDMLTDLRRSAKYLTTPPPEPPATNYLVRPTFEEARHDLLALLDIANAAGGTIHVAGDIETRAKHIACFGYSCAEGVAACIPFMCVEDDSGYWDDDEEFEIVQLICLALRHPNILWIFQNGLYDLQYLARHWITIPSRWEDTMILQHTIFPGRPKSLDYISSMYCDWYRYWKDEGKEWDKNMDEDQLWEYNCKDASNTLECYFALRNLLDQSGLEEQFGWQMRTADSMLRVMLTGVRCDLTLKAQYAEQLEIVRQELSEWIDIAVGRPFNPKSPKQMQELFYGELGFKPIKDRKSGSVTTNKKALQRLVFRQPLLRPLVERIEAYRSIGVFLSTFVKMKLSRDDRMRCSYNVAGTDTYRLSSSTDAFGSGTNLQNIPSQGDTPEEVLETWRYLPNVRRMFKPDPGKEIADIDLDRADAQVVAWDANDEVLKQIFREGLDLHMENAKMIYGERATPRHRALAKAGVHATNYYASARTLAVALGITVKEAEDFQRKWFRAHPAIPEWHDRVNNDLITKKEVRNAFGYRFRFFDRPDGLLPQALAWIPQSTVAIVTNRGLIAVHQRLPKVDVLLQVHDSIVIQYLRELRNPILRSLRKCLSVEIPYPDPLTIPLGVKVSESSWGECKEIPWPEPPVRMIS